MNRKIIIALIIVVLIILGGLLVFSSNIKTDTEINFLSAGNLQNGAKIEFELKDAQGALANQKIDIKFTGNGENQNFTITTDDQGKGSLILKDENPGNYSISVSYAGDEKHNGCSANQNITIGDGTSESLNEYTNVNSTQSTNSAPSTTSDLSYDSELNENYDSNGKIVGGQNDGADYNEIKNNQPTIVNGSLE